MIPAASEPNAPPTREPARDATVIQAPYRLTTAPRPTTWAAQSAAVLGNVALVVGLLFALVLVPVLAVQGIAAAAGLLIAALRGNG